MCGRSTRGKRNDATRKFSPCARRATVATSMRPSIRRGLRRVRQRWLNQSRMGPGPGPRCVQSKREGVPVSSFEGAEPAREDPVTGVERNDGAVIVKLGGELDLY